MFSNVRIAARCVRTCSRPSPQLCARRSISYTHPNRSELAPEPPSEADLEDPVIEKIIEKLESRAEEEGRQPETYNEFMESMGEKFKKADGPNKWLGGTVPFPMNPSFKPPAPVSDAVRTMIYRSYMLDPVKNSVRVLSQRYHLSLKRVDAILRLKGMEHDWVKGKTLQTGFLAGMEKVLGVDSSDVQLSADLRKDAHEADVLEQEERRDAARQRYQQLYWESVPEDGREPIVPASLEHARSAAKRYAKAEEAFKSNPKFMPRIKDNTTQTPKEKVQVVTKTGRPSTKFVDVGGHFIEVDERLRRIAESERRAKIKARRAEESKAAILEQRAARS
ncbi:eukaryotic mitochondrial regulator protein-domain-containing protein [Lyophyllum atratum]|nr:eukaryotic mitochondrial regulator protein-domain-containing protein [Lyophyllum atratum]